MGHIILKYKLLKIVYILIEFYMFFKVECVYYLRSFMHTLNEFYVYYELECLSVTCFTSDVLNAVGRDAAICATCIYFVCR